MEFLDNPHILTLSACGFFFVIGVMICIYVVIQETIETGQRRTAKRLLREDQIRQEAIRRKRAAHQPAVKTITAPNPIPHPIPSNPRSFA